MPTQLPLQLIEKSLALINLGAMMKLFSVELFPKVIDIIHKLYANQLFIQDLQAIQYLCSVILESSEINNSLREDVNQLRAILDLFINTSAAPTAACGRWAMASM